MDGRQTLLERHDELRHHGGNINAARCRFPNAPTPWIDLSTGINPRPYPIDAIAPDAWNRLPDPSELAALEQAARTAYGADPATAIVAAPGTQALLQWLPRVVPARRVGILGFTYGEHEKCWRAAGAEVTIVDAVSELTKFDVAVAVTPNNPDGRVLPANLLAATAGSLAETGGLLILDEAFMDVLERRHSLVPLLPRAGALVLRSFGKIYGLAGLRLGFAVASPKVAALLRAAMGPWAVSGPAIEIGRRALADAAWLESTLSWLDSAADRLDGLLRVAGFTIMGGTKLFRLASHHAASDWFERLAQCGILTRPFHSKPNWLRFGLPGAQEDWQRLETALLSRESNMRTPSSPPPAILTG
jgi:cobalamin biosynthetic protein CobC